MADSLAFLEPLAARETWRTTLIFPCSLWWAYERWLTEDPAAVIAHFTSSRPKLQRPLVHGTPSRTSGSRHLRPE